MQNCLTKLNFEFAAVQKCAHLVDLVNAVLFFVFFETPRLRAKKMLSNAYFLAKFRFDTAENEPAKNLQQFANFANPNQGARGPCPPRRVGPGARRRGPPPGLRGPPRGRPLGVRG